MVYFSGGGVHIFSMGVVVVLTRILFKAWVGMIEGLLFLYIFVSVLAGVSLAVWRALCD